MVNIQIPPETERLVIMVNCSIPFVNHTGQSRLGQEGVVLALKVRQQYEKLLDFLRVTAVAIPSGTTCYTSEDLTAQQTFQIIFKDEPEALAKPQLNQLAEDQHGEEGRANYLEFLLSGNTVESEVCLVVAHEPHISQAAINHLPSNQLGLNPCEAIVFFIKNLKGIGEIVGAIKFVPMT